MLSDVSSLTDLSSDEDDSYVPPSKIKKPAAPAKKTAQYTLKNCLRPPRASTYSAQALYDQIHNGSINLNPEYQRDVVWTEGKQSGLIDSILRNYYIPPVIFAVYTSDDGAETRVCIDGKQRLTSIQKFMDGLIPHKDSRTNMKLWYKGSSGKHLPVQYRNQFANKQVVCVEYEGISDDAEREIFQRVQLGVALTPAERMQAIPGPWSGLIREIQSKCLGQDGFGDNLEWSSSRGRDFQCVTSIVYLIEKLPSATHPSAPVLERWLQRVTPPSKEFHKQILDVFRIFVALVRDPKYNTPFQRPTRVSPIEFVMCGVLIWKHMSKLSHAQLATAITKMRTDVRNSFSDIRANAKVLGHMCSFIHEKFPRNLKGDGAGDRPALQSAKSGGGGAGKATKRKRVVESSDDEDEIEERPLARNRQVAKKTVRPESAPKSISHATPRGPGRPAAASKVASSSKVSSNAKAPASKAAADPPRPKLSIPLAKAASLSTSRPQTPLSTSSTPLTAVTSCMVSSMLPPALPSTPVKQEDTKSLVPASPKLPSSSSGRLATLRAAKASLTSERRSATPSATSPSTTLPSPSALTPSAASPSTTPPSATSSSASYLPVPAPQHPTPAPITSSRDPRTAAYQAGASRNASPAAAATPPSSTSTPAIATPILSTASPSIDAAAIEKIMANGPYQAHYQTCPVANPPPGPPSTLGLSLGEHQHPPDAGGFSTLPAPPPLRPDDMPLPPHSAPPPIPPNHSTPVAPSQYAATTQQTSNGVNQSSSPQPLAPQASAFPYPPPPPAAPTLPTPSAPALQNGVYPNGQLLPPPLHFPPPSVPRMPGARPLPMPMPPSRSNTAPNILSSVSGFDRPPPSMPRALSALTPSHMVPPQPTKPVPWLDVALPPSPASFQSITPSSASGCQPPTPTGDYPQPAALTNIPQLESSLTRRRDPDDASTYGSGARRDPEREYGRGREYTRSNRYDDRHDDRSKDGARPYPRSSRGTWYSERGSSKARR